MPKTIEHETLVDETKSKTEKRKLFHVEKIKIIDDDNQFSKEYWKAKQFELHGNSWIVTPFYKTFSSERKGREWLDEIC